MWSGSKAWSVAATASLSAVPPEAGLHRLVFGGQGQARDAPLTGEEVRSARRGVQAGCSSGGVGATVTGRTSARLPTMETGDRASAVRTRDRWGLGNTLGGSATRPAAANRSQDASPPPPNSSARGGTFPWPWTPNSAPT